jgi:MerR family mercuric resistance operon transcriptional regulator
MRIGKIAEKTGIGVETVRFYERKGLIAQPAKPASGFRRYDGAIVARLRFIRQAQTLGFSLKEIGELLSLKADPMTDCADVRRRAKTKRDEVVAKIAHLETMRRALDTLIAACPGRGAIRRCSILDALQARARPKIVKENDR